MFGTFSSSRADFSHTALFSSSFTSQIAPQFVPQSINAAYHTILHTDGGERVFREFGLEPGKRTVSPFRHDATKKNFSVFHSPKGEVLFKDFVSGDGGAFTALLHGFGYTTFESQIRFAASLYGITIRDKGQGIRDKGQEVHDQVPTHQETKHQRTKRPTHQTTKFYRVTDLHLDDFSSDECRILADISHGAITRDVLERFGIRALRSFTDEGRSERGFAYGGTHQAAYTLVVPSANGNFYAYCYHKSDVHSPFPNKAKNFHLKLHEYSSDVKFALGLNELRPNEAAYIVEGIKDCLILLAHGYNAFTLGGVQHRLHPRVVEQLMHNNNHLHILFDTDFAGLDAAQKLHATLNTQHSTLNTSCLTLPRLQQQITKDAPKPAKNDLADYVCEYGFDALLTETLLPATPLHSTTFTKGSITIPAWKLSIQNKLGTDAAALKALANLIDASSRLVLNAPTGCGKTHTLLRVIAGRHFEKTQGMTVFAVPTIALAEQICEEYADLNPICVSGDTNDLHRYYQHVQNEENTTSPPLDTCIIVAVYDSIHKCMDILLEETTLFCIDEMHTLVHDYDYRTRAMRSMNNAIKHAPKVVCMSATPELFFHAAPMNFTYCTVEVEEQRPRSLSYHDYDKRDEAVLERILQFRHQEPNNQAPSNQATIFLRVQSKSLLKRVQKLLIKYGTPESDIALLSNDTTATSEEYKVLLQTRRFSRPIILATSILDTGVNILNTGQVHVIMLDEPNEDTIIQVANRFRQADNVHVHLLKKAKGKGQRDKGQELSTNAPSNQAPSNQATNAPNNQHTKRPFAEQYHFFQTLYTAQMMAETMNTQAGRNDTTHGIGRKSSSRLFDTMLHFDAKSHRWTGDELAVMHQCAKLRVQYTSPAAQMDALENAGFVQKNMDEYGAYPLAPELIAAIAQGTILERNEQRHEQDKNDETIFHLLEHKTAYFLAALNSVSRSRALRDNLRNLCPEALVSWVKNHAETAEILAFHTPLLREARTETLVRYYSEARTLGFDHNEALHLVRTNNDARAWRSLTEHLAILQREAIHLAGLTDSSLVNNVLNKHDREKLRRENEMRRLIRHAAEEGCAFTSSDGTERRIAHSIRSKKELAERVNAYNSTLFRLTQQKAGKLVDAMFHVRYVRERTKTENGVKLSGYYVFETDVTGIKRKTLAEFVTEYGVDGAKYEAQFIARMHEAGASYEQALERVREQNPLLGVV